jgi:hypothetical protein
MHEKRSSLAGGTALKKEGLTVVFTVGVVTMRFLQEGGALPSGKRGNFEG